MDFALLRIWLEIPEQRVRPIRGGGADHRAASHHGIWFEADCALITVLDLNECRELSNVLSSFCWSGRIQSHCCRDVV